MGDKKCFHHLTPKQTSFCSRPAKSQTRKKKTHDFDLPLTLGTFFWKRRQSMPYRLGSCFAPPHSLPLHMGKNGAMWHFFRALFPSTWRTLSPDALLTRIWDTRKNTQNVPHFRAFFASIQEHCPPKCLFFMANAKLPNRPCFAPPTPLPFPLPPPLTLPGFGEALRVPPPPQISQSSNPPPFLDQMQLRYLWTMSLHRVYSIEGLPIQDKLLNNLNRDMFKSFRSHSDLLGWVFGCVLEDLLRFKEVSFRETHLWEHFWSDRQNCSHNVSQKVKRIRRLSEGS